MNDAPFPKTHNLLVKMGYEPSTLGTFILPQFDEPVTMLGVCCDKDSDDFADCIMLMLSISSLANVYSRLKDSQPFPTCSIYCTGEDWLDFKVVISIAIAPPISDTAAKLFIKAACKKGVGGRFWPRNKTHETPPEFEGAFYIDLDIDYEELI